ncbi:type I polyketide synthase [Paenibacillus sp. FSL R7-0204]|uniref:type I polyketide synthase n=1 Tax=Paenibacillus sp. FSL R7-0204 TaxID=2921675 RepID=UPI0030F91D84
MEEIIKLIIENTAQNNISKPSAVQLIKLLKQRNHNENTEVAIIGVSGRFAESSNLEEFWNLIAEGKDGIRELPAGRKADLDDFLKYIQDTDHPDYAEKGYIDDIDKFDYSFFKISPREASVMDPNQRLFLQAAYHAIEDGGYGGNKLSGTRTGIYLGNSSDSGDDYKAFLQLCKSEDMNLSFVGNIKSMIAARLAYLLDLKGPSMLVDTACSSALLAVHLACQAIRKNDCDMALAGGIKLSLLPLTTKKSGPVDINIESPDGRARTFDFSSEGTGLGEGVGVILLKPLNKAIQDKDNIYAVIKGSAINQDGNSIGITAPNPLAQKELLIDAWEQAKIDPETITYIEAHGTGTRLGDPLEIDGIDMAFREYTGKKQFCAVSSVKSSIGHLDHAAGIAGLIKAVLALKYKKLPPSLHFTRPNSKIDFSDSPVFVNDILREWECEGSPRRCGVSSFGLSGTNSHVILEEAPASVTEGSESEQDKLRILTLSAKTRESLHHLVEEYCRFTAKASDIHLDNLCYTANTGRGHYTYRAAILFTTIDDLRAQLNLLLNRGMNGNGSDGVYCGVHHLISSHKHRTEAKELTEEEFNRITGICRKLTLEVAGVTGTVLEDKLKELCGLYIAGADVNWSDMYEPCQYRRISLPVYPFMPSRCWINLGPVIDGRELHPLADKKLIRSVNEDVYIFELSSEKNWILSEHRVMGRCVLPGTAYLDMMINICHESYPERSFELGNVTFLTPMIVEEGEPKTVHICVTTSAIPEFVIASKSAADGDGDWTKHAVGSIIFTEHPMKQANDHMESLWNRFKDQPSLIFNQSQEEEAITTGPRWKTIVEMFQGDNEALAYLELPEIYNEDLQLFTLHPSLMDCAVNLAINSIGEGLYLPFGYKRIKVFKNIPGSFYSYVHQVGNYTGTEARTYNITLFDAQFDPIAEIEGYTIKKVNSHLQQLEKKETGLQYYEMVWSPLENENVNRQHEPAKGITILFKGSEGASGRISDGFKKRGMDYIEVQTGDSYVECNNHFTIRSTQEDYTRLLEACQHRGSIERIIHLLSLDDSIWDDDQRSMNEALKKGVISLFYLTKALIAHKIKNISMYVVSDYAYRVTGKEQKYNPHNAALFGLCQVIGQEYDNIYCKGIDIEEGTDIGDIWLELNRTDNKRVSYRASQRYVPLMEIKDLIAVDESRIPISNQGVYIITGGTGGLGMEMIKFLASKDNVNICILSRTPLPEREKWDLLIGSGDHDKLSKKLESLKAIEESGTQIDAYTVDVSDFDSLRKVYEQIILKHGKVNGVIHCAGIAGDGFIFRKNEDTFKEVMAAKIQGTYNLDRVTSKENMDFFVMFSSVTSILGGAGQSDYTAANAYMDTYSWYRNGKGQHTVSINWPAWSETGIAFDYGLSDDRTIFRSISNHMGIQAFEHILQSRAEQVLPGVLNETFLTQADWGRSFLNVSDTIKSRLNQFKRVNRASDKLPSQPQGMKPKLRLTGRAEDDFNHTEQILGEIWMQMLGLNELNIYDNFYDLGGDSILATGLLKEIVKAFGEVVDIADIFTFPTIINLAEFIDRKQLSHSTSSREEEWEIGADIDDILDRLVKGEIDVNQASKRMEREGHH